MGAAAIVKEVLFVEDDDALRERFAEAWRQTFSVAEVKFAGDALQILRRRIPDLILLDLGMPPGEMSGMELLARLRENKAWATIPVIVLSEFGDLINPDIATRLGIHAVFTKSRHHAIDLLFAMQRILDPGNPS